MNVRIEPSWHRLLAAEWDKSYFAELVDFVRNEYATRTIYPPASRIFAAFDACPVDDVKVVILGQDPYHGPGMANGLCFSVNPGVPVPRSLVNIFKEIHDETGSVPPADGDLSRWARQGVLLLNATLTVRHSEAASHQGHGWERFTDEAVRQLAAQREGLVFMLWGSSAGRKAEMIDQSKHLVLRSAHPSPLSASRGFFGNRHFVTANDYLRSRGLTPIEW